MNIIQGNTDKNLNRERIRIAIVASRFNAFIVDPLIEVARKTLLAHGIKDENITLIYVPGAFEIPTVAQRILLADYPIEDLAGMIALGAVIRGETPHFDYVAGECARGIAKLNLCQDKIFSSVIDHVPIAFGVLTTDNVAQAKQRSAPYDIAKDVDKRQQQNVSNKGMEAALALIEMIDLYRKIGE